MSHLGIIARRQITLRAPTATCDVPAPRRGEPRLNQISHDGSPSSRLRALAVIAAAGSLDVAAAWCIGRWVVPIVFLGRKDSSPPERDPGHSFSCNFALARCRIFCLTAHSELE